MFNTWVKATGCDKLEGKDEKFSCEFSGVTRNMELDDYKLPFSLA